MATKKQGKEKVYEISFEETDMKGLICPSWDGIGDVIEGEIENYRDTDADEFHITVKVKYMSAKQLDKLPEYEG